MFIPSKDWSWWNSVNFFWTMPAFIAWYLISYPLFKKINSSKKMAVITLITSIAAPFLKKIMYHFASEQFVNWNFFCLIYAFCLGALAYFVIKEKCHLMGILYGVVIGCLGLIANNRSGFFVFGLLFYFAIVVGSMIPIRWENEKVNKAVKTLSAITYSTYLTHWFVVQLIGDWFKLLPWFVAYILFIVIANIIGYLFYVFVEKYFAKILTDRFLNKELGK
jgi:peptidoglycan/LPS O-acetylase OafA/YrhL